MANFINFQAEDDGNNSSDGEFHKDEDKVSLSPFINDSNYENNPSDYYGFTNVSISVVSAEEDSVSKVIIAHFCDNNIEARNDCANSKYEMSDNGK